MRANIDLTHNRIFMRSNGGRIRLMRGFPWDFSPHYSYEALILTGNRAMRISKRNINNVVSGQYCDCCGKSISRIPWRILCGLCYECQMKLNIDVNGRNNLPWDITAK